MCYNKDTEREVIKMTIKEMIEIFTEKLASGEWSETDEIVCRNIIGFIEDTKTIHKDHNNNIRFES